MTSKVYYKFSSALQYTCIEFDGNCLSVPEIKHNIVQQKHLTNLGKGGSFELVLTNSETGEEYQDSNYVPKNTYLSIRRLPLAYQTLQPLLGKTIERSTDEIVDSIITDSIHSLIPLPVYASVPAITLVAQVNNPKVDNKPNDVDCNQLKCSLCNSLFFDAVVIKCCFQSFCNECIRQELCMRSNLIGSVVSCPSCNTELNFAQIDAMLDPNPNLQKLVEQTVEAEAVAMLQEGQPLFPTQQILCEYCKAVGHTFLWCPMYYTYLNFCNQQQQQQQQQQFVQPQYYGQQQYYEQQQYTPNSAENNMTERYEYKPTKNEYNPTKTNDYRNEARAHRDHSPSRYKKYESSRNELNRNESSRAQRSGNELNRNESSRNELDRSESSRAQRSGNRYSHNQDHYESRTDRNKVQYRTNYRSKYEPYETSRIQHETNKNEHDNSRNQDDINRNQHDINRNKYTTKLTVTKKQDHSERDRY